MKGNVYVGRGKVAGLKTKTIPFWSGSPDQRLWPVTLLCFPLQQWARKTPSLWAGAGTLSRVTPAETIRAVVSSLSLFFVRL